MLQESNLFHIDMTAVCWWLVTFQCELVLFLTVIRARVNDAGREIVLAVLF